MKRDVLFGLLALLLFTCFGGQAAEVAVSAGGEFDICKGESKGRGSCTFLPSARQHHIGCKDSHVAYAQYICTLNNPTGTVLKIEFTSSNDGGMCGTTRWHVTCGRR